MENKNVKTPRIQSVSNGFGEYSTYINVGGLYNRKTKIAKIETEMKTIGAGYYNDITINCYVAYDASGNRLAEITDGMNIDVRYFSD